MPKTTFIASATFYETCFCCTRVFSTANEEPADALYRSVMTDMKVTDTWVKESI